MARRERDFYPTPGAATRALLSRVGIAEGVTALECCAGAGDITRELRGAGLQVVTNDIDGRSDFRLDAARGDSWRSFPRTAWVITNPPFKYAPEIVPLAYEFARRQSLGGVAMLLRLSFLEPCDDRGEWLAAHPPSDVTFLEPCDDRGEWLAAHPPSDVIVLPRISFTGDGRTDNVTCAWLVWRRRRGQSVSVVTKGELAALAG